MTDGEPTYEQLALRAEAFEERDAHRQQLLGELPVRTSVTMRGTRSAGHFETGVISQPEAVESIRLDALEGWIHGRRGALRDRFTQGYNPDADGIKDYTMGRPVKERTAGKTPAEKAEFRARMQRRAHHIADKLQAANWQRMVAADVRRAALEHVGRAVDYGFEPLPEAVTFAADAIVNFGLCLGEEKNREDIGELHELSLQIEQIGAYLAIHPEALPAHRRVIEVVRVEQARRYRDYGRRYHDSRQQTRPRLTAAEQQRGQELAELVKEFRKFRKAPQ